MGPKNFGTPGLRPLGMWASLTQQYASLTSVTVPNSVILGQTVLASVIMETC